MMTNARNCNTQRRYARVPVTGTVEYRLGAFRGTADLRDAGLSGLSMAVDRNLLPGQRVMVETVNSGGGFDRTRELKGVVSWVAPSGIDGEFLAGIRIYCTDEGTREAMHELVSAGFTIRKEAALRQVSWGIRPLRHSRSAEFIDTNDEWTKQESTGTLLKHTTAAVV